MSMNEASQRLEHSVITTILTSLPTVLQIDGLSLTVAFAGSATSADVVCWKAIRQETCILELSTNLTESGRINLVAKRLSILLPLILAYHRAFPAAGEADLGIDDYFDGPGLAFCSDGRPGSGLLPDPDFIIAQGYEQAKIDLRLAAIPWEQRAPLAFWRGSSTGLVWRAPSWREMPRIKLNEIASGRRDIFDVGLSNIVQIDHHAEAIEALGYLLPAVPALAWSRYRYQIDVDGNSNAWAGFFQRLLTGSPVLKVESPFGFRQWYYHRLEPWRHYVPVASDMSDLIEKVEWLLRHDALGRLIGEEGRAFAERLDYAEEMKLAIVAIAMAMTQQASPLQVEH